MKIQMILLAFCLSGTIHAARPMDRMVFFGVGFSYHDRLGHLKLSDGSSETIGRADIPSVGVVAGKRFALSSMLRLQVPISLDYGTATENPYESFDAVRKSTLFHFALIPVLQLPLRLNAESAFYLSAGGGAHLVRFTETNDDDLMSSSTCPSVSFTWGAGFETMTAGNRAITVSYSIRYGKPIYYKYMKDLFPYRSADYKETCFTHSIQFLVLVYKRYR